VDNLSHFKEEIMPSIIYDHTKGLFQRSGTGIAMAPQIYGETVSDTATATNITATAGVEIVNYTGAAAATITLPAATVGEVYIYVQSKDVAGGTDKLAFDCAGTDVFETGSLAESRSTNEVAFDTSTEGETKLEFTPVNSADNYFSTGSRVVFMCVNKGKWHVEVQPRANPAGTGLVGAMAFAA
jgi:hypothetical protein